MSTPRPVAFLESLQPLVTESARLIKLHFLSPDFDTKMEDGMFQLYSLRIPRWAKYWIAWTAAGLFYISQDFMTRLFRNQSIPWRNTVLLWMAVMYTCAAFTPWILWMGRRWAVEEDYRWRPIALHLGASLVFSLVSTALEVPVLIALGMAPKLIKPASLASDFWYLLPYDLHGGIIRYWAVVGLQALFRSNQKARHREREAMQLKLHSSELAEQLTSAQLSALKMQLHPHFLFNTLSAIVALVRQHKAREAETMLSRLSDLLRFTLDDVDAQEVPLWRELDFLRLYLSIEQVRFEDRLRVRIDAGPDVSDALVPHMALQPVVENAVRHGLGQSEEPVLIQVRAIRADGHLTLTVTDDGPGCLTSAFEGKGIGLTNTRSRLKRLYGAAASLSAENRAPRGVQVTISLPYRIAGPEEDECA